MDKGVSAARVTSAALLLQLLCCVPKKGITCIRSFTKDLSSFRINESRQKVVDKVC